MKIAEHLPELLKLLLQRVSDTPTKTAYLFLLDSGATQELSYEELYMRSSAIAQELAKDTTRGARRALLIHSAGTNFIISLFACFLSNTSAIPIAIPKPRTKALFQHFLAHAQPHYILTTSNFELRIKKLMEQKDVASINFINTDMTKDAKEGFLPHEITNEMPLIQYTSGTTTVPKGVIISFENLAHNLRAIRDHFQLHEKSVAFSWLPHYHDMGLIDGILTPIFNDCIGILCSPVKAISNPFSWLQAIDHYQVTHTGGPNFFLDVCVSKIPASGLHGINLRSLSHLYVSAEPVRKKTLDNFASFFQSCGFSPRLFTPGYGLAEATLMVTCKSINAPLHYLTREVQSHEEVYVGLGKPIDSMHIKIIERDSLNEVTQGEAGEICLRGPSITLGYFNDTEATSRAFVSLAESNTMLKYFRTGDVGILQNGELFVMGRLTDTLLIRGLKYQPEDLEYVVSKSHSAIRSMGCAVFSVEHEGEEVIAVLQEIKKTNNNHELAVIKTSIKDSIYQAFGLSVFDIILLPQGQLLKTTSGKIRRGDNRAKYLKREFMISL